MQNSGFVFFLQNQSLWQYLQAPTIQMKFINIFQQK